MQLPSTSGNTLGKWKWPLIIIVLMVGIVLLLSATKPAPPKTAVEEKEWLVSTEVLAFDDLSPQLELLGTVRSPFDSDLSAAITADVLEVPVREGERVSKGQMLIQLDNREINLLIAQHQADIKDLNAQILAEQNRKKADQAALEEEESLLSIAEKSLQRQATLQKSNLIAQERYDQAASERAKNALSVTARKLNIQDHPARMQQLRAKLDRAETALQNAQLDLERTEVKAPFDGVITEVSVSPGERAQTGQSLLRIYDQNTMEVRAQIPDVYVSTIRQALQNGHVIKAKTQSYGIDTSLLLKRLSGQANRGAGGIDALFIVETDITKTQTVASENPEQEVDTPSVLPALLLNSSLKVKVSLPALEQITSVPVSSIYGTNRVYRVEEGRLQSLDVNILGAQFTETGKDRVLIASKLLNPGDEIITTQLPNALSGLKVKTRE